MKRFDPASSGFAYPAAPITTVPVHGVPWSEKWRNWWASATIASPTSEMSKPASLSVDAVRRFFDDVGALNDYYVQETEYSRYWIRNLLALGDDVPVILDASGSVSSLLVTRMFAHIGRHPQFRGIAAGLPGYVRSFYTVTVTEEGALDGPNACKNNAFRPVTSLFYEPAVLAYPEGMETAELVIDLTKFDNAALVEEIAKAVQSASHGGTTCGVIHLPTVAESGRLMPVKEVADLVKELRASNHNIFFVVDDIQGMGRRDADSLINPLTYCDAYLLSASKALGGLLTASASVLSEELAQIFIEKVRGGRVVNPCIAHFQFEPRLAAELPDWVFRRGAVSIPEIVAMNAAFMYFYQRGKGLTFQQKRLHQLALVEAERAKVVAAISSVRGLKVVEPTSTRPIVPSIVSFTVERDGWTPHDLRKALQQGSPIVTPAACVGSLMRVDIPEYRSVPPCDVLADKLERVLALK